MLRSLFIFTLTLLIFASCKKTPPPSFSLKMDLNGISDTINVLLYRYEQGYAPFDTARKDAQGYFIFTKTIDSTNFFLLKLPNGQSLPMVLGPVPTYLHAEANNLINTASFSNNLASDQIRRSMLVAQDFSHAIKELATQLTDTLKPKPKAEFKDSLIRHIDTIRVEYAARLEAIIREARTPGILHAILQRSGNQPILTPANNRQLFVETDSFLFRHYAHLTPVKQFHYQLDSTFNNIDSLTSVHRGEQLPDAGLKNIWDEHISLFRFRGRPLLVVVWSPNDSMCNQIVTQSRQIIKQFKPKGLEVYMVAVDTVKTNWTQSIDQHRLACWHVSDLQGHASPILHKWGIRSLPATFLLNVKGEIEEKNLEGNHLMNKLTQLLPDKEK
ncbi:MAG: redoxin domain-containing protein [Marinilabiliaceae bacterium]|nr:redoxin domain-containing protein [Marinilabiliaceae bacterium]